MVSNTVPVQAQGRNIRRYSDYFIARARGFADTKVDYVRNGQGRLKRLTVDKGMLRETEAVQRQIKALLRCDVGWLPENVRQGFIDCVPAFNR